MFKVIKYVIVDILRNRFIFAYTAFLLVISLSVFNLESSPSKGLLSMLNIILIIVPLVSLMFSIIYMYNSVKFIELLLSQPIKRGQLLLSLYTGVCASLLIAFFIGVCIPVMLLEGSETAYAMMVAGLILTAIFVSLSVLGSVLTRDKAKGIGIGILIWLYFTLIYDGLLLLAMFQFSDYPIETPLIFLTSLNPVDLARILILLKMDISALMSFTGAIFDRFFGTAFGFAYSFAIMLLWLLIPMLIAMRRFKRMDL